MTYRATAALLALWLLGQTPASGADVPGQQFQLFSMGQAVRVGELEYSLKRAFWLPVRQGSREEVVEYLAVELKVRNLGNTLAQIPPFKIFDDEARLYEPNYAKLVFPKMSLNPGEVEGGLVLFLPPKGRSYVFIASSEYRSAQFALIRLEVK